MKIQSFFDIQTSTFTYVVFDETKEGVVIDPVLNFDIKSGKITKNSFYEIVDFIKKNDLKIKYILETHAHADHLTSAKYLKKEVNGLIGIGKNINKVQDIFANIFNLKNFHDINYFDLYLNDTEVLSVGNFNIEVIALPGHTPACIGFKIEDNIFVGDTIFMPDVGSARCDFPGGSAEMLYESVQKIFAYNDDTKLFMCHDYPTTREVMFQTTVGEQKQKNIHLNTKINKESFIKIRNERDKILSVPQLIYPSLQVNIRAGELPQSEDNGMIYFKTPIQLSE